MNNYNDVTATLISVEHNKLKGIYGTLRLKHHIESLYGLILNHKLIRRYKGYLGLKTNVRKRRSLGQIRAKERNLANKVPNILNCNFNAAKPLEKLSSDVSYIQCSDGTLYLSAIKDIFNTEIISCSTSNKNDMELVLESCRTLPKSLEVGALIHTDQGSLYRTEAYQTILSEKGYERSMSRRGCCWENSPIENWFSQLKEECIRPNSPMTRKEASELIKKYVQWYSTERIQKDLGYLSPIQFKHLFI